MRAGVTGAVEWVALPINNEAEIRFQPGTTLAADGEPSGEPSVAAWFACGRADPDVFLLFLAADAFVPAVNELGITSWSPTIELTVHVRAHPAPGWLRVVRTTNVLWNSYFEEDSRSGTPRTSWWHRGDSLPDWARVPRHRRRANRSTKFDQSAVAGAHHR